MKDFLIAFSASTAAIAGIIFAFLISKALVFESSQSDILDSVEKKLLDIKKINSKLLGIFISIATYDGTEKDLLDEYNKKLEEDYLKWENQGIDYWVEYVKEDTAYYLDKNEGIEKLNKKKHEFLEEKYQVLKKYIEDSGYGEVTTIDSLEEHKEFVILKSNVEYYTKLENDIRSKRSVSLERSFENILAKSFSHSMLNVKLDIPAVVNWNKIRETQKEIRQLLVEYSYKKEEIEFMSKKIISLKKERDNIYVFLGTAYFMIIFGVIYPLSYIKYPNEAKLDYTLHNNFWSELFSFSGLMLVFLFIIFTIFTLKIYFLISSDNELNLTYNKLKNGYFLENKSSIIENFEFCENYIDTKQ